MVNVYSEACGPLCSPNAVEHTFGCGDQIIGGTQITRKFQYISSRCKTGALLLRLGGFVITTNISVSNSLISREIGFWDKEDGVGAFDISKTLC